MRKLGRLEEIPLRDIWAHEQYDFSEWLSKDENLNLLGEQLGLTLVEPETERYVGIYRCDIVCKDEMSGKLVLIENQLEPTNHDHLGKIITYASGLKASVVVWVVESAKEEHASAIEWLNEHIDSSVSFFLIEVHALKIGNSDPAPMFKIIEQPNDFVVETKKSAGDSAKDSERKANRFEFWSKFNDVLISKNKPFNVRKASTDHWYDVVCGKSGAHFSITLVNSENKIGIELYITDDKTLYDFLFSHKDEIEKSLGYELNWMRLDGKKASRIITYIPGLDFNCKENYPQLMDEIINKISEFKKAFGPFLK